MDKLYDRCLRCHRKLKNEEARKIGYGKICLEKSKHNNQKPLFEVGGADEKGKEINKGTKIHRFG